MTAPYAILFHWRLKPGREADFTQAWEEATLALREQGSLGSTLFEASDGSVYALARWPDKAARDAAAGGDALAHPRAAMADAIAESFPPVELAERINHWVLPS